MCNYQIRAKVFETLREVKSGKNSTFGNGNIMFRNFDYYRLLLKVNSIVGDFLHFWTVYLFITIKLMFKITR